MKELFLLLVTWWSILDPTTEAIATMSSGEVDTYLKQFGYLKPGTAGSPATAAAIRKFQKMATIPETGLMDDKTVEMMKAPRCGNTDKGVGVQMRRRQKRYALEGSRWAGNTLLYRITRFTRDLPEADQRDVLERAFDVWESHVPLSFRETTGTPDVEVRFETGNHGDGSSFDGSGGTLAHAFYPQYGGDVHLDDAEGFTVGTSSGTNLMYVLVHEIGHALGLQHTNVSNAIMYPFYRGYIPNLSLHEDDINGARALYGPSSGFIDVYTRTDDPFPVFNSGNHARISVIVTFAVLLYQVMCRAA